MCRLGRDDRLITRGEEIELEHEVPRFDIRWGAGYMESKVYIIWLLRYQFGRKGDNAIRVRPISTLDQ